MSSRKTRIFSACWSQMMPLCTPFVFSCVAASLCEQLVSAGEDIAGLEAHVARTLEDLLRLAAQDLTGAEVARVRRVLRRPCLRIFRRHDRGLQVLLVDVQADDVVVGADLAHLREDADENSLLRWSRLLLKWQSYAFFF